MAENYDDMNKAELENLLIERDMEDSFTTKSTKEELVALLQQSDNAGQGPSGGQAVSGEAGAEGGVSGEVVSNPDESSGDPDAVAPAVDPETQGTAVTDPMTTPPSDTDNLEAFGNVDLSSEDEYNSKLLMGLEIAVQQLQTQKTVSGGNPEYNPSIEFLQNAISERQPQG